MFDQSIMKVYCSDINLHNITLPEMQDSSQPSSPVQITTHVLQWVLHAKIGFCHIQWSPGLQSRVVNQMYHNFQNLLRPSGVPETFGTSSDFAEAERRDKVMLARLQEVITPEQRIVVESKVCLFVASSLVFMDSLSS